MEVEGKFKLSDSTQATCSTRSSHMADDTCPVTFPLRCHSPLPPPLLRTSPCHQPSSDELSLPDIAVEAPAEVTAAIAISRLPSCVNPILRLRNHPRHLTSCQTRLAASSRKRCTLIPSLTRANPVSSYLILSGAPDS
ncbi:unnamed protein product [Pleuronectes platessa]|uniref:Uncharacterized protein n=1 Tax=Pleuronectes platessa TaxID=8262 RepID=A0A9N7V723_PLEPL|nr:unnamed protein product [Pleuronectes platessa]